MLGQVSGLGQAFQPLKHQLDAPSPMAISRSPRVSSSPGNGVLHRRLTLIALIQRTAKLTNENRQFCSGPSLYRFLRRWNIGPRLASEAPIHCEHGGGFAEPLFIRPYGRRTDILPFDPASRGNVDNPSPRLRAKTAPTEQPIRFPLLYLTCKRKLNWPLSRSSDFFPMQHDKSS
jgi:hypothetical protein